MALQIVQIKWPISCKEGYWCDAGDIYYLNVIIASIDRMVKMLNESSNKIFPAINLYFQNHIFRFLNVMLQV